MRTQKEKTAQEIIIEVEWDIEKQKYEGLETLEKIKRGEIEIQ